MDLQAKLHGQKSCCRGCVEVNTTPVPLASAAPASLESPGQEKNPDGLTLAHEINELKAVVENESKKYKSIRTAKKYRHVCPFDGCTNQTKI